MNPWKGIDEYTGDFPEPSYRGPARPMWDQGNESSFMQWFSDFAKKMNWNPNPDDPGHSYDYRAAYQRKSNPNPNAGMHWPSDLKYLDHPRRFINGYDTTTGMLAPKITNWVEEK